MPLNSALGGLQRAIEGDTQVSPWLPRTLACTRVYTHTGWIRVFFFFFFFTEPLLFLHVLYTYLCVSACDPPHWGVSSRGVG